MTPGTDVCEHLDMILISFYLFFIFFSDKKWFSTTIYYILDRNSYVYFVLCGP